VQPTVAIHPPAYNRVLQLEPPRHYFRRLTHADAGLAWTAFRAFEGARLYDWVKLDFSRLFEQAEDLSQLHKPALQCGFWDLCHIVAAQNAELPLVTCDVVQSQAAKIVGVKATLLA
jgi:hypothetical protein